MNWTIYIISTFLILLLLYFLFSNKGISTDSGYFELIYENEATRLLYQEYAVNAASFWSDKLKSSHKISVNMNDVAGLGSNVLAAAYITRKKGRLPSAGVVSINSTTFLRKSDKIRTNIMKHEFGHILGIGGEWVVSSPNDNPHISSDAYPNTLTGYKESTGYTDGKGVPVENEYGAGSQFVHFEENDRLNFGLAGETAPGMYNELMTAIIKPTSILSKASLGFLKDLGWDVDMNKADPGILFSASSSRDPDNNDNDPFNLMKDKEDEGICGCGRIDHVK